MSDEGVATRVVVVESNPSLAAVLVAGARGADTVVTHLDQLEIGLLSGVSREPAGPRGVVVLGPSLVVAETSAAIPEILARGWRVLVISADALDERGAALLLAGASGFLVLSSDLGGQLLESIRAVAAGTSSLHPLVVDEVLRHWRASAGAAAEKSAQASPDLTPRERDVLRGLKDGLTSRMLASKLGVAEKTIEAHKSRLYTKIGARNQAHAVRIAIDMNLV